MKETIQILETASKVCELMAKSPRITIEEQSLLFNQSLVLMIEHNKLYAQEYGIPAAIDNLKDKI